MKKIDILITIHHLGGKWWNIHIANAPHYAALPATGRLAHQIFVDMATVKKLWASLRRLKKRLFDQPSPITTLSILEFIVRNVQSHRDAATVINDLRNRGLFQILRNENQVIEPLTDAINTIQNRPNSLELALWFGATLERMVLQKMKRNNDGGFDQMFLADPNNNIPPGIGYGSV